jgi:hypothetical protein
MQGRQEIQPKMFYQVTLDDLVPADNFYRKLGQELDLAYLYKATAHIRHSIFTSRHTEN